jgi:hypothetical protein
MVASMRRPSLLAAAGVLAVAALAAGCDSSPSAAALDAWKEAGLEPTSFADADPAALGARQCQEGKVNGVYVTLCQFPDRAAAAKAKTAGLAKAGDTTVVALARGSQLMIAADKDKIDPSGRTVNKLSRAFWSLPVGDALPVLPEPTK